MSIAKIPILAEKYKGKAKYSEEDLRHYYFMHHKYHIQRSTVVAGRDGGSGAAALGSTVDRGEKWAAK
jgi:hypothetical protein